MKVITSSFRSTQSLAAFIFALAQDDGPAGRQVRTFIVGDDREATMESVRARMTALGTKYPGEARYLACEMVDQAIEHLYARMRQRYGAAEGERRRTQWHELKQQRYELKCGR